VPSTKPFDLFDPKRAHRVKLYVKRVFITDEAEGLVPPYLRFLRGVVDSEDLPLNISREMLQHNPMLAKIKAGITRRVLGELAKKAGDPEQAEAYGKFWNAFGAVLKEGLYEDFEHRAELLKLLRFRTSVSAAGGGEGLVSLADYLGRLKEGQDAIYTLSGDDTATLLKSPQLEGFRAKGVEVLLLTDPVDEFWVQAVHEFEGKPFKSVTRGGADLAKIKKDGVEADTTEDKPAETAGIGDLLALLKLTLTDAVKDVRVSERLTDSPVCLVADENDMDMHLERLLKQHHQLGGQGPAKRILEINAGHGLIQRLAARAKTDGASGAGLEDAAWLLLDQALIVEGEPLADPAAFARRMASAMERGL
jgi:molecular chaperone HtpG